MEISDNGIQVDRRRVRPNYPAMSNTPRFEQIRAFVTVAKHGSFRMAAEELGLNRSSVTDSIQQIEAATGVRLFTRTTRRVELTQQGLLLLPAAQNAISHFDEVIVWMTSIGKGEAGVVSLVCTVMDYDQIIAPSLSSFTRARPDIRFTIQQVMPEKLTETLLSGDFEIGIAGDLSEADEFDVQTLAADRICLVTSRRHPLAGVRHPIRWSDVAGYPYLAWYDRKNMSEMLSRNAGISPRLLKIQSISSPAIFATTLMETQAFSLAPMQAKTLSVYRDLTFLPLQDETAVFTVSILTRRGVAKSRPAELFIDHLRGTLNRKASALHPA